MISVEGKMFAVIPRSCKGVSATPRLIPPKTKKTPRCKTTDREPFPCRAYGFVGISIIGELLQTENSKMNREPSKIRILTKYFEGEASGTVGIVALVIIVMIIAALVWL